MEFDKAELPEAAAGATCLACKRPITDVYWEAGGRTFCQRCRDAHEARKAGPGPGFAGFLKASALGIGGGLAGAVVWFLVEHFAHLQIGIIAILVGWLVGRGVAIGTGHRGGRRWQILAVAITWVSIGLAEVPSILLGTDGNGSPMIVRAIVWCLMSPAIPALVIFGSGASGLISAFIFFIGLQQAWSANRRVEVTLTGPHVIAPPLPEVPALPPPLPGDATPPGQA